MKVEEKYYFHQLNNLETIDENPKSCAEVIRDNNQKNLNRSTLHENYK